MTALTLPWVGGPLEGCPIPNPAGVATMASVCQGFLLHKAQQLNDGELSPKTYDGYQRACNDLLTHFGHGRPVSTLRPADFFGFRVRLAKRLGPRGLGTHIRMVKTAFRWAWKNEIIPSPPRYGDSFQPPPKAAVRRATPKGGRVFTPHEIRRLLDAAAPRLRAFILLGLNCAYGQRDISDLPAHVARQGVDTGQLRFARPKTGIDRQAVLWPQTREALRDTATLDGDGPAYLTRHGLPYVRSTICRQANGDVARVVTVDSITPLFNKLRDRLGIAGRSFYGLRRTFRTIGDAVCDRHAAAVIMGHEITGIEDHYIEHIGLDRLRRVSDHVARWAGLPPCTSAARPADPAAAPLGAPHG